MVWLWCRNEGGGGLFHYHFVPWWLNLLLPVQEVMDKGFKGLSLKQLGSSNSLGGKENLGLVGLPFLKSKFSVRQAEEEIESQRWATTCQRIHCTWLTELERKLPWLWLSLFTSGMTPSILNFCPRLFFDYEERWPLDSGSKKPPRPLGPCSLTSLQSLTRCPAPASASKAALPSQSGLGAYHGEQSKRGDHWEGVGRNHRDDKTYMQCTPANDSR